MPAPEVRDSTALLRSLHRLQTSHDLSLHVAHLNHDFRGAEADHDAAFVQRLANALGLPCSIDKRDPIAYQRSQGVSSFEQAAREMRYSFLLSVASTVGASAVALGHTSDDQAETVLLHILRGSGLQGLRGMTDVTGWPWPTREPGPLLYRPLLSASKAETAAYCRELGQTYREDSGNYLWRFTRNRVRLDLMPRLARDYNPRVQEALLRLSRTAAEETDYLDSELENRWQSLATVEEGAVSAGRECDGYPASGPAATGTAPGLRFRCRRRQDSQREPPGCHASPRGKPAGRPQYKSATRPSRLYRGGCPSDCHTRREQPVTSAVPRELGPCAPGNRRGSGG